VVSGTRSSVILSLDRTASAPSVKVGDTFRTNALLPWHHDAASAPNATPPRNTTVAARHAKTSGVDRHLRLDSLSASTRRTTPNVPTAAEHTSQIATSVNASELPCGKHVRPDNHGFPSGSRNTQPRPPATHPLRTFLWSRRTNPRMTPNPGMSPRRNHPTKKPTPLPSLTQSSSALRVTDSVPPDLSLGSRVD
jgi:hypothetical protein